MIHLCVVAGTLGALGEGTRARAEAPPPPADVPSIELPATLSLDDAIRIFRARGLELLLAEAAVTSAEADTAIAGSTSNPVLSAGYGRVLPPYDPGAAGCSGCSANQWTVGVSDSGAIFDALSGKRGLRKDVAAEALKAAKMNRVDAGRVLEFQIKQQYFQTLQARAALDFAKDVQEGATRTLELNKLRYPRVIDEGALARVETAKLEADQAVDAATQNLRLAHVGLAYLLGVRGRVPEFDVVPDLIKYAVPPRLQSASPDALLRDALQHRADLRAAGFLRSRADAAIALAKRRRFPDVALSLQYSQTGTGSSALAPPTVGIGVAAPIPLLYQQQGEIRRAQADATAETLQQVKLEAQIAADVESAFTSYATSRRLVERMESSLLERARKARDIIKLQFDAGAAPLMDYLDAQRTYIATNLEYIQDLAAYWTAVAQLEQAVGMELRK
jgi:cobalt-zinc-cadmium efflux system outer membrane protein